MRFNNSSNIAEFRKVVWRTSNEKIYIQLKAYPSDIMFSNNKIL